MVLVFIFLMTSNVQCLSICLFAIIVSSLVKCLFKFRLFCTEFFVFLLLSSKGYLCILDICSLLGICISDVFFPRLWFVLISLTMSLEEHKFSILMKPSLLDFSLWLVFFVSYKFQILD